jgi:hypothetical protein
MAKSIGILVLARALLSLWPSKEVVWFASFGVRIELFVSRKVFGDLLGVEILIEG